ncbi:MAG: hypothetical protein R3Y56_03965 [Akkermansia sp.]
MKPTSTLAAFLSMAALAAPMVSYAQDPAVAFSKIQSMSTAGNNTAALAESKKIITLLENPKSRVVQQFSYMLPFFYWQQAGILQAMGDNGAAYDAYKKVVEEKRFRNPSMIAAAANNPGRPLDFRPFFTTGLFQMGYCLFNQASGTDAKPGDPSIYPKAIEELEKYVKLAKSGGISDLEKKQQLEGKATFLILQACLLQTPPDFAKAESCFQEMSKSNVSLPDDMVMQSLGTIVKVVGANPEQAGWINKVIEVSRDNYDIGVLRGAKYGDKYLNYGIKLGQTAGAAYKAGNLQGALDAARSAFDLYSLVPNSDKIEGAYTAQLETIGKSALPSVPDIAAGVTYSPKAQEKILKFYQGLGKKNQYLEGMSLLGSSAVVMTFGSNRLGKAAYQLLIDRYPNIAVMGKDKKLASMKEKNLFQLSQLCRATGDEVAAIKIEKQLEKAGMGGSSKTTLLVNKMSRHIQEAQWDMVIPAADEVLAALATDKENPAYATAEFCKVAAYYKLQQFQEVADAGEALLKSGLLKDKLADKYEPQCLFFTLDAYNKLGAGNAKHYDRAMELVDLCMQKYPSTNLKENALAANVCYTGIDTLLKRRGHGVAEADKADMEKALQLCQVIADNWPEHGLYRISQLLAGSIRINGQDEEAKVVGIQNLEAAYKAAIELPNGEGLGTASNGLFWLISYSPEIPMPDESEEAAAKRIAGYVDVFWKSVDRAGDHYCLQVAHLDLKRAYDANDAEAFTQKAEKLQSIIARESNNNVEKNVVNAELEAIFADYCEKYFSFMDMSGKSLSVDEKLAFFDKFPGINKADKYTNAIVTMCKINTMLEIYATLEADAKPAFNEQINQTFREMTRNYKPADLTNYICVQVGNFLVDYVKALPDQREEERKEAMSYYEKAITDPNQEQRTTATLGKANALAISANEADRKQAAELYSALVELQDYDVLPEALAGLTRNYMTTGDYAKAIETGEKFLKTRASTETRLNMLMLMGEAYAKMNDSKNALITYGNVYNQNRGRIGFSAPACVAMMDIMWARNNPKTGDHIAGTYKPSDRWTAWSTGQAYVTWIEKAGIEPKMTSAERDAYRLLRVAVDKYSGDAAVQAEDKAKRDFDRRVSAGQ